MQTIRVTRTQKTAIGMLHAGTAYTFDPSKPGHSEVAKRLLDREFGEVVSEADLKKEQRAAERLKKALAKTPSAPLASQKEFHAVQSALEAATAHVEDLKKRAETAEASLEQQHSQVEELAEEVQKLKGAKAQVSALTERAEAAEASLEEKSAQIEELSKAVKELEAKVGEKDKAK